MLVGLTAMGLYSRRQRARLTGILVRASAAIGVGMVADAARGHLVAQGFEADGPATAPLDLAA